MDNTDMPFLTQGDFVKLATSTLQESSYDYVTWVGLICLLRGLVAVLGLSGNAGSIRTFISMGLRDWGTASFAWLSVADSLFLLAVIVVSFAYFLAAVEHWCGVGFLFPVDPFGVGIFFVNSGGGPYTLTMLITTFIAFVRCMGVVKPLTFRHALSIRRTVIILLSFSVFSLLSVIPILVFMFLKSHEDDRTANSTRLFLWLSRDRKQVKDILWPIRDAFLPLAAQVILLLCVYFMARSLRESSRFRHAESRQSKQLSVNEPSVTRDSLKIGDLDRRDAQQFSSPPFHLGGKELRVIQQMLLISSIFIVCNIPKIVLNLTELCVPEFNINSDLQGFYYTMVNIRDFFQTVNSSVNILIYYKYSSKFRQHFTQLFLPTMKRLEE